MASIRKSILKDYYDKERLLQFNPISEMANKGDNQVMKPLLLTNEGDTYCLEW